MILTITLNVHLTVSLPVALALNIPITFLAVPPCSRTLINSPRTCNIPTAMIISVLHPELAKLILAFFYFGFLGGRLVVRHKFDTVARVSA
jgi:hypothetical protein